MRLYSLSLAVSELVRVCRYYRAIFRTAMLAWHFSASFK
jgi:hypothetical protein